MLSDPDRIEQNKTFRTRLAANVSKYITSRYCPTKFTDSASWDVNYNDAAIIDPAFSDCDDPSAINKNQSGYFYYQGQSTTPLNIPVLTVKQAGPGDIVIKKPTVLYVTGADVYIQKNIKYSGIATDYPSLVIVVQKDSATGK